ncbi:tetratricopeptide repeat protein [Larkinella terrae]|uniref:Tetratricopeptide repeat protein n=1 Tax=Larkinella terrae TaxID=2025311 RepID=A0A7K0EIN3_9BACT|nr:tetratricopeptide repeat protein [Larkinella terrae]MRS61709.1 tetratricopeptide repeat protein [Larkinella terrae]
MRILLFLLVCFQVSKAADFEFTPNLQRGYADILKLKVQGGRQAIAGDLAQGNGVAVYVDDFADMVTLLVSDNPKLYGQWSDREDQRLDRLRDLDENSPWQRFAQAEVRLHWAFVKLKFGKEVSACWDVIRAYKLLEENRKKFPGFLPTYKSLGLLHVMIGAVPDNYTWVTNLLGMRGNVKQGLQEIRTVAQKDAIFQTEAELIDLLIRAYVLKFTAADFANLKKMVQENRDNLLLHFFATSVLMKDAQSEEAFGFLNNRPAGPDYLPFPILEDLKADILLQKADYPQAAAVYRQFLTQYKGVNFLKDTYYKLFLCYWLAGEDAKAEPFLRQVSQVGAAVVESDKVAQKFADQYAKKGISLKVKILMKARLATDGGFYETALQTLRPYSEASFSLLAEKAEFNYRKGRIAQRQGDVDEALPYFERAIVLSETDQLSFGATSALQLGYIYQQKRNPAKARQYFQKALSYKKHEYKNSIDNKARAALNELSTNSSTP